MNILIKPKGKEAIQHKCTYVSVSRNMIVIHDKNYEDKAIEAYRTKDIEWYTVSEEEG